MVTGLKFIKDILIVVIFIAIAMVVSDKYYKSGIVDRTRSFNSFI